MNNQQTSSKSNSFMIDNLLSNNSNEQQLPLKKRQCLTSVQQPVLTNSTHKYTNQAMASPLSQLNNYFNHSTPSTTLRLDHSMSPSNESLFQNYYAFYAAMASSNNRLLSNQNLKIQSHLNSSGYSSASPTTSDSSISFMAKKEQMPSYEDSDNDEIEMDEDDDYIEEEDQENQAPTQVKKRQMGERREKKEWIWKMHYYILKMN